VHDAGTVQIVEGFGDLIDDVFFVDAVEETVFDGVEQITFHMLED
jgi:hypothetical protein